MRLYLPVGLLVAVAFLSSCETLSKDECLAADWRVIGEQDGSEGYSPQQRFSGHVKACERAGVVPDQTLWNVGYQNGLLRFCTPSRGLSYGQAGTAYQNVCPPALEPGFLSGYQLGREESDQKREIRDIENRINGLEREIDELEEKISKGKVDEFEAERTIRRKRRDIRNENRTLGRAEADLGSIQRRIDFFRQNPAGSRAFN